ncbi:hypothetical protein G7046_g2878 [Stylonectria norvegica]|nr:hypothetical protein G7046_g2878 [Stylonectria norvegica]
MSSRDDASLGATPPSFDSQPSTGAPPTFATFSPVTLSANTPSRSTRRSTILVHQKSPLLLATPPQITRALAYSHPFLLPLNTLAGLLTWSSGDPWQSFLLLCTFWAVVLYGDVVVMWAGPVVVGMGLIAGMYGRRYSPLSSSGWNEPASGAKEVAAKALNPGEGSQQKGGKAPAVEKIPKHKRGASEVTNTKHQKTLDEIVEILKEFTGRCNILLEPLMEMTDFLSTQRTATSATTRPALTVMFMRLLIITPFWIALTIPPWRILTTRRIALVVGTLMLTWHARVLRVARAILWRSSMIRRLATGITGLRFEGPAKPYHKDLEEATKDGEERVEKKQESELTKALRRPSNLQTNHRAGSAKTAGVKFTFIIYENQRRWIGLGWTNSLFAYERPAWTDEHNNSVPQRDEFELPDVEDGSKMKWRWVQGSRWRVDGVSDDHGPVDYDGEEGGNGWIFYDNKWQNGRRGQDGWGRWTRRRKWYRDAELVEMDESQLAHELDAAEPRASTSSYTQKGYSTSDEKMVSPMRTEAPPFPSFEQTIAEDDHAEDAGSKAAEDSLSVHSTSSRSFFRTPLTRRRGADRSTMDKERTRRASDALDEDDASGLGRELTLELQKQRKEGGEWGIGDEARMSMDLEVSLFPSKKAASTHSRFQMASPSVSFKDPWRQPQSTHPQNHSRSRSNMEPSHDNTSNPNRLDPKGKKSHRANLTISLSPRPPRATILSPQKPSTARSAPGSAPSPERRVRKEPVFNLYSASTASPDSAGPSFADPYRLTPFESQERSHSAPEQPEEERAASTETVRGPRVTPPLTPFPPWVSGSEGGEDCDVRGWGVVNGQERGAGESRGGYEDGRLATMVGLEGRWLLSSVMHGVVLAMQCAAALIVFAALAWMSVWKMGEEDSGFWQWFWKYAEPSICIVILLCSTTLIAHEATVLSAVAILYLQSAILIATTATSLALWVRCFEEESRAVKSVMMGCNVLIWGLAFFAFVRAVVLWKFEERRGRRGGDEERGDRYGTFAPQRGL